MHGARFGTPGTEHSKGKKRMKAPKSRRRYRSLIEEEVEGPLIWSWSERTKVPNRIRAIDLERASGRRFVTLGKFNLEICVCGDVRTPKGRRAKVHKKRLIVEDTCQYIFHSGIFSCMEKNIVESWNFQGPKIQNQSLIVDLEGSYASTDRVDLGLCVEGGKKVENGG
jgi:hypothetical protein